MLLAVQIINLYFIADICLQFFLPYQDQAGAWVKSKRRIASRYTRTWLPLDIASVLPIDIFVMADALHVRRVQRTAIT